MDVRRPLAIERVEVGEGTVEALVRVTDPALRSTANIPGCADRLMALLPGLVRHSCDNDAGVDFTRELRDTELAHAFEHVAAELMALSGSPRTLRGETRWNFADDGAGVYRVTLSFDDDLVALAALREAAGIVAWASGTDSGEPCVDEIAGRMRALRSTPH